MSVVPEESIRAAVLERHLSRVVIPIVDERTNEMHGAGFLLQVAEGVVFVTADHVYEDIAAAPERYGIPLRSDGDSEMWTLGRSRVARLSDFDIACIVVDPNLLPNLLDFWTPIACTGATVPPAEHYLAFGYPAAGTRSVDDGAAIASRAEFVKLGAHPGDPLIHSSARPFHPNVDLMLTSWDRAASVGTAGPPMSPKGMSGGPVWAEVPAEPLPKLRLAGVQVGKGTDYTRATRIELVASVARRALVPSAPP